MSSYGWLFGLAAFGLFAVLLLIAFWFVRSTAKASGRAEAQSDSLRLVAEKIRRAKKALRHLRLDPDERKRLRNKFRR